MDIKALQLCSHFALQPNQLGYCGKDSASAKLQKCLLTGQCDGVEEELKKFIVLHPYLQTIAEITGKNPFSYEVIEAYWLGNDLLKLCKPEHYQILVKNLQKQGVSKWLVKEIKDKQPKAFIPIHLFNILHIGVGRASGSVEFTPYSINHCMLRWGKITKINKHKASVMADVTYLELDHKLSVASEIFQWNLTLVPKLKIDDLIIVHWGWVAKKIILKEEKQLQFWTKKFIHNNGFTFKSH